MCLRVMATLAVKYESHYEKPRGFQGLLNNRGAPHTARSRVGPVFYSICRNVGSVVDLLLAEPRVELGV